MRRFRLRRLWRVNCEGLLIATGQDLKRLLQRRGWGRRPFPTPTDFAAEPFAVRSLLRLQLAEGLAHADRSAFQPRRAATNQTSIAA